MESIKNPAYSSHPSRGAWIEIKENEDDGFIEARRTPRGVRGLKLSSQIYRPSSITSRTPRGVRGLKSLAEEHKE